MSRYTDVDAIIEDLRYDIELDARTLDDLDFADAKERELVQLDKVIKQNAISILEQTPTADVVEIVRYKDCIHHKNAPRTMYVWCENVDGLLPEDWFCADGERKEDDGKVH